jgi:hypothetical protein
VDGAAHELAVPVLFRTDWRSGRRRA